MAKCEQCHYNRASAKNTDPLTGMMLCNECAEENRRVWEKRGPDANQRAKARSDEALAKAKEAHGEEYEQYAKDREAAMKYYRSHTKS